MNTKQPVGIGFVGLGWPGQMHAKAAQEVPSARIAAGCDLSEERRQAFDTEFSPPAVYEQYEDLLADPAVGAVIVSLPNFLHHNATMAALRAGKHVLCEKPPTMNVPEIESIRQVATERGLTYAFSRQSRFNSKMLAVKRLVEDGTVGKVYFARAERVRSRGIPVGIGGWFLQKEKAGGGAMIDIGVHAIDAAWYLAGCPRPVSVSAQVTQNFRSTLPAGTVYDVEDGGYAMLRFEGGLVIHLEVSWAANLTESAPVSTWAGHELEDTTLYGDRATVRLDPPTLYQMDGKERRVTPLQTGPETNGFAAQLANFVHAIQSGTPPISNVEQAVSLMKMLAAVYESSASGAEVRLLP